MRTLHKIVKDDEGATLVEFTVVAALLFLLTFSIMEFALILYQFNNAQKATQLGARAASSRALIPDLDTYEDCWVSTSLEAGTACAEVQNSSFTPIVCTGGGTGICTSTGMAAVVAEMKRGFPKLNAADVTITFSPTQLGYEGRGRPIPAITVAINNIQYEYAAIGGIIKAIDHTSTFANTLNITTAQTTVIGEDIKG